MSCERARLYRLRKNSGSHGFGKGTTSSRAVKSLKMTWRFSAWGTLLDSWRLFHQLLQPCRQSPPRTRASAPEVRRPTSRTPPPNLVIPTREQSERGGICFPNSDADPTVEEGRFERRVKQADPIRASAPVVVLLDGDGLLSSCPCGAGTPFDKLRASSARCL